MAAIVAPNIVTDGLVAYWDAGNRVSYPGAGTVWTDLVSGRVGTFYNDTTSGAHGPDFVGGNMGYLEFDGTDEWIKGPADGSDMDLNVHVSMSCWVWWDRGGTGNSIVAKEKVGSAQYVMGRASTGFGFYWALNLDGVWTNPLTTETLSNDQWYHITGTYDGVSMEQYIDGVLVKSTAATGAISGDSSPFYIGGLDWAHNGSTPDEWLAGRLSTVQVYNKGLTAAEVLQNYNATRGRFGV
jgi:hypothetical protein